MIALKHCSDHFPSKLNRSAAILENGCNYAENVHITKSFICHISVKYSPICNSFEFLNSLQTGPYTLSKHFPSNLIRLERIANRIIFNRDMADKRFRNTEMVSVMTAIFQDGGQTVTYMSKQYKRSIEGLQ